MSDGPSNGSQGSTHAILPVSQVDPRVVEAEPNDSEREEDLVDRDPGPAQGKEESLGKAIELERASGLWTREAFSAGLGSIAEVVGQDDEVGVGSSDDIGDQVEVEGARAEVGKIRDLDRGPASTQLLEQLTEDQRDAMLVGQIRHHGVAQEGDSIVARSLGTEAQGGRFFGIEVQDRMVSAGRSDVRPIHGRLDARQHGDRAEAEYEDR
jgi:hypothetical protein